jgi:acyl-CoA hydrolase
MPQFVSAAEAVSVVESGQRVFVHGASATPHLLLDALAARASELKGVELVHLHTEGTMRCATTSCVDSFRVNTFFVAENVRQAVHDGRADYIPIFLSEIPALFLRGDMPIDVALVQVSEPDKHGFCTLGISVDIARAAVAVAKQVIGLVNPRMPRTHGDGFIHTSRFHALVRTDEALPEHLAAPPNPVEQAIGRNVASLVEDGATLQMGIGGIPNAVLAALQNHRHLGIHTEMFSDGVIDLVERGAITGEAKRVHPGKLVADFVDDNPLVAMLDIGYINDTEVIRRQTKMTAINSAIEIDLTGQICADSIGTYQYSGVGGQMDFIRGAALSEGGKPIIALSSITKHGVSRIVPLLQPGASVVTTRAHVHYVVTEYGVASLHGKNLHQRARALIDIAHPTHREELLAAARARFGRF